MKPNVTVHQVSECLYEIPIQGNMRVPGRIYANEQILTDLHQDESMQQVINVAQLPGVIGYSLAMPDIHWGYGFPIGGVAAMDLEEGVVTPGGIGYDINCGVRLMRTNLKLEDIQPKLREVITALFQHVPSGVGSESSIRLSKDDLRQVLTQGAKWAISKGYGRPRDLEYIEENGCIQGADPELISDRAMERGLPQIGTLGSGNHFLEVDIVEEIYDEHAATVLGFSKGQIAVQVHTGSRGFGHQVCEDYIKLMKKALHTYHIEVADPQLCCAPLNSKEGKQYCSAMACAANYAFVNRQMIKHFAEQALLESLGISPEQLNLALIYDICHNIGKFEEHEFAGKKQKVFVHRKGATRAFAPHHPSLPPAYQELGQPVLIPGDMGRYSFLLLGTEKAMQETFGSCCHGAGRNLSRTKALQVSKRRNLIRELEDKGILVAVQSRATLGEESSEAYKDVQDVVNVMDQSGISRKVLKLRPLAVTKG